MAEIFKINLEPNIDYENTNFNEIKEKLKNLRLNITEEIKCMLFIKNKIESKEDFNNEEQNFKIDEKIQEKYAKIFNKLGELCTQEINLISETIVNIDEFKNNKDKEEIINEEYKNEDFIFDKINFTLNNYNKIIDNINKTISSLPYIFNLYLLYNKTEENENKYIRENINIEEEKYCNEAKNNFKHNKIINNKKIKNLGKINTMNDIKDIPTSKRERMVEFSKSVKNKSFKKDNSNNQKNTKSNENLNNVYIKNDNSRENLKELIFETEMITDDLKDYVYNNCVKENELKNILKMKEENKMLNEEIINIKNSLRELNNLYEYQLERLECLKNEQCILEKENIQLCEYINKKLIEKEQQINIDKNIYNDDNKNDINIVNNFFPNKELNGNNIVNNNPPDNTEINITPVNFESIEMFKRLNNIFNIK